MTEISSPQLSSWESFYVIVGSSGAALIGLQFVVLTLLAETRARTTAGTISAFGTPTIVHLGGALIISAIMSAPWSSLFGAAVALVICGLAGTSYGVMVIVHARRQTDYRPTWEDWLWHVVLPCGVYAALALAALFLRAATQVALFAIGGAALGLLLIGIYNAWDAVTYHVVGGSSADTPKEERSRCKVAILFPKPLEPVSQFWAPFSLVR